MVDVTIDDLPDGGAGLGPDEFEIWRVGTSLRLDLASIAQYANGLLTAGAPTGFDTFAEVASALSGKQPLDATLTALAGVTFAADKGLYSTAPDAFATFDLTSVARSFLAATTVPAQREAIGVNASRLDPVNPTITVDDFEFASTETGEIGLGWGFTNGTWNLVNPEAGHPGTCRRTSTAVAGVVASWFPGGGGATPTHRFDQQDEQWWVVKPVTADADFDIRLGWSSDFTSATGTNGYYFEKLTTDSNWFRVARVGGVQTRTDTGVAFSASWFKFKLRRVSAGVVGFSVNGGAEVTISTNVPAESTVLLFGGHIIPQAAFARALDLDFYSHRLVAQTR